MSGGEQVYGRILHRGGRLSIPVMLCRVRGAEFSTNQASGDHPADADHRVEAQTVAADEVQQGEDQRVRCPSASSWYSSRLPGPS